LSDLWRLQIVGVARLLSGDEPPQVLPLSRKDAGWLACVGLGTALASSQVATLVWPAARERGALNNLRQRVHRLRRSTGARLVEMAESIALAADLSLYDPATPEALAQSPSAWDAELLAGMEFDDEPEFAAWLAAARLAQAQRRREALGSIAARAEGQGELVRAFIYAQRLLADDPLSEHAHRRLMRLHYLRGDTAAAVAAFESCERVLKDELGLRPSAETLALLQTVERSRNDGAARGEARAMPASLARPPRLVGRLAALQALADAEQQAQVAVLVGEAGMGKTRLLQEQLSGRADALRFQARPGDAAVPYAALGRLSRVLEERTAALAADAGSAPAPAPALASAAAPATTAQPGTIAVVTCLQPSTAPQRQAALEALLGLAVQQGLALVAADDLHFADSASVELLLALIESDALSGLRWIIAQRPAEAAADVSLLAAFAESPQARWVRLEPLAADELHELVASLDLPGVEPERLAPALLRHTGGNPLFVIETLRAAVQRGGAGSVALPRPQALAHLIDQRLSRLSRPAMALARVAAMAAPDFGIELAEHVLHAPALVLADAWQELEAAQVLRGEAFAHDLVHDAVLRLSPDAIARHTHRQIAAFLAGRGAEPARVAEHWLAAGDATQAAVSFRTAAEQMRRSGRPREQAQLLLRAADAFEAGADGTSALRLRSMALLPLMEGHGLAQAEALSSRLIDTAGDGPLAAMAWTRRASLLMHAGQAVAAEVAARRALQMLAPQEQELRIEATAALALALRGAGRAEDGLELLRPWAESIDTVANPLLRIEFHSAHAVLLHNLDRLDEAARALQSQIDETRVAGETGEHAPIQLSLAAVQLRRGSADAALHHAQVAVAEQPDFDLGGVVPAYTRFLLGCAHCAKGRYGDGLALLAAARQLLEPQSRGTPVHSNTEAALAEVLLQIGQPAKALQTLVGEPAQLTPACQVRRWLVRAAILRTLGQDNRSMLDAAQALVEQGAGEHWRQQTEIEGARRLAPHAAIDLCTSVLTRARRHGDRPVSLLAATVRLDALRRASDADRLDEAAFEVLEQLRGCQTTLIYRPEVHLACARAFAAAGQSGLADHCLVEARDWIREVALPNLPDELRHGFLFRCAVNMAIQGEASQRT